MDAVAAAVAALGAADRYAKEIVAWQARLDAWEAAFFAWQGDGKLIPPPTPPTTSRWPTTDEAKSAQREAAYNAAGIVRSAATLAPNLVLARLTALLRVYCRLHVLQARAIGIRCSTGACHRPPFGRVGDSRPGFRRSAQRPPPPPPPPLRRDEGR